MKTGKLLLNVITIVLFSVSFVQANVPKPSWQAGKIVLWNNEVLEGELVYNWLVETVQFRQEDGRIRLFPADQIRQFGWFDTHQNRQRDFMALTDVVSHPETYRIYEVCMDGPLAVVRRLKRPRGLWKRTIGSPVHFNDKATLAQNPDFFDYYVHDAGRLLALDRYYKDIYEPLMTSYAKQIDTYTETHNINDRTLMGRLILISHYNTLVEQSSSTASARNLIQARE
ncbi:hypothetical protein IC229_08100 [Spirosoma sp. BT702]|uniref:Uncharacterized protein n=1 Tax=Spirosoma profusum TaxID=2771354 RepID=A0A926XZ81_9BACT|nr:hypothetical protein [Spirosoma profusum]MBD2700593.1 hypothetical protein [Spirosoma profusum]